MVDLWCFFTDALGDETAASYRALLDPSELARLERFVFEDDRRTFLATRALVGTALSAYAPVAPRSWRFRAGAHGRPSIANAVDERVDFNLSNTRGLVVCAVSLAYGKLGVDVEHLERRVDATLMDAVLSERERSALGALPAPLRAKRFVELWTLKESYCKAEGVGLSVPLDRLTFTFDAGDVRLESPLVGDPSRWRFALLDVFPHHLIALAARVDDETAGPPGPLRGVPVGQTAALEARLIRFTPLRDDPRVWVNVQSSHGCS